MKDELNKDADVKMIREHANQLGEHYENVQIFCSQRDGEKTLELQVGIGNFNARYGQIKRWVIRTEEQERIDIRNEMDEEDEE